jgi:hypothetical protein
MGERTSLPERSRPKLPVLMTSHLVVTLKKNPAVLYKTLCPWVSLPAWPCHPNKIKASVVLLSIEDLGSLGFTIIFL